MIYVKSLLAGLLAVVASSVAIVILAILTIILYAESILRRMARLLVGIP
jgi:hypothetical protein